MKPISETTVLNDHALEISRLTKAFSNESRVRIIRCLARGTWRVQEIAEETGLTYGVVSQQIVTLRRLGYIEEYREGVHVRHGLVGRHIRLMLDAFVYIFDEAAE